MRKEYPLTAAQNMHYQWIREYKTPQVSGVSIVASLKSPLDFGMLKKCIQLEIGRYGCMRLRFTKPDAEGVIKQYVVNRDARDIPLKDLSGMTMKEADDLMQLYTHYRFGSEYPKDLADFEKVLESDLKKAGNEKRFAKDKKFWDDQLDELGEPLYP